MTSSAQPRPIAGESKPASEMLLRQFSTVRAQTEGLCAPLEVEDHLLQAMADASPPKWQLAHTTWFFETFVLQRLAAGYEEFHPQFGYLFNSYYHTVGPRQPRGRRSDLSRPTLSEVMAYRAHVDRAMTSFWSATDNKTRQTAHEIIELGIHHEQQHQELLLTDTKYNFSVNVLRPNYLPALPAGPPAATPPPSWVEIAGGEVEVGHAGSSFSFDNERPRHRTLLRPFRLRSQLVTCGEYLEFMQSGGYDRSDLWLSDGWDWKVRNDVCAPLYWEKIDGKWMLFTLRGLRAVAPAEPLCHVSFYEADAYATWAGARLPTECEWEHALGGEPIPDTANFMESGHYHPVACASDERFAQAFGDVWEWTSSPYVPYPGYQAPEGAFGEYNGKFMINQLVLRGGSCATPRSHIRGTYRNFFYPHQRWQFMGVRLAGDLD